ncbi:MAG: hypothetical protein RLZZ225_1124 [Pseudomonadota bacterium]
MPPSHVRGSINLMPEFVSNLKEHIIATEFWRLTSFVCKRALTIAKLITNLPLPFAYLLYILHIVRSGLRIFNYFYKTKNKNLGDTLKFFFALFKVSIAMIALILLGYGFAIPTILLSAFFAYNILKLIHSGVVLLFSTMAYLRIDKSCLEQQWARAQYQDNIRKHLSMLGIGLLFILITCIFISTKVLMWSNPLLLLADVFMAVLLLASTIYCAALIRGNRKKNYPKILFTTAQQANIRRFLSLFGLAMIGLTLTVVSPLLGAFAISLALILLSTEDIFISIYYYFYSVYVPNPIPANLVENNVLVDRTNIHYYQTSFPVLHLRSDDMSANKVFLLKVSLVKLLRLENKLNKLSSAGTLSAFFLDRKKLVSKKEYLMQELMWALNITQKEDLIHFFIISIMSLYQDRQQLLAPYSTMAASLSVKTRQNIQNIAGLEADLGELLDTDTNDYSLLNRNPDLKKNLLLNLFWLSQHQIVAEKPSINKPKQFYQSFWKKLGDCEGLSQAFQSFRAMSMA